MDEMEKMNLSDTTTNKYETVFIPADLYSGEQLMMEAFNDYVNDLISQDTFEELRSKLERNLGKEFAPASIISSITRTISNMFDNSTDYDFMFKAFSKIEHLAEVYNVTEDDIANLINNRFYTGATRNVIKLGIKMTAEEYENAEAAGELFLGSHVNMHPGERRYNDFMHHLFMTKFRSSNTGAASNMLSAMYYFRLQLSHPNPSDVSETDRQHMNNPQAYYRPIYMVLIDKSTRLPVEFEMDSDAVHALRGKSTNKGIVYTKLRDESKDGFDGSEAEKDAFRGKLVDMLQKGKTPPLPVIDFVLDKNFIDVFKLNPETRQVERDYSINVKQHIEQYNSYPDFYIEYDEDLTDPSHQDFYVRLYHEQMNQRMKVKPPKLTTEEVLYVFNLLNKLVDNNGKIDLKKEEDGVKIAQQLTNIVYFKSNGHIEFDRSTLKILGHEIDLRKDLHLLRDFNYMSSLLSQVDFLINVNHFKTGRSYTNPITKEVTSYERYLLYNGKLMVSRAPINWYANTQLYLTFGKEIGEDVMISKNSGTTAVIETHIEEVIPTPDVPEEETGAGEMKGFKNKPKSKLEETKKDVENPLSKRHKKAISRVLKEVRALKDQLNTKEVALMRNGVDDPNMLSDTESTRRKLLKADIDAWTKIKEILSKTNDIELHKKVLKKYKKSEQETISELNSLMLQLKLRSKKNTNEEAGKMLSKMIVEVDKSLIELKRYEYDRQGVVNELEQKIFDIEMSKPSETNGETMDTIRARIEENVRQRQEYTIMSILRSSTVEYDKYKEMALEPFNIFDINLITWEAKEKARMAYLSTTMEALHKIINMIASINDLELLKRIAERFNKSIRDETAHLEFFLHEFNEVIKDTDEYRESTKYGQMATIANDSLTKANAYEYKRRCFQDEVRRRILNIETNQTSSAVGNNGKDNLLI